MSWPNETSKSTSTGGPAQPGEGDGSSIATRSGGGQGGFQDQTGGSQDQTGGSQHQTGGPSYMELMALNGDMGLPDNNPQASREPSQSSSMNAQDGSQRTTRGSN